MKPKFNIKYLYISLSIFIAAAAVILFYNLIFKSEDFWAGFAKISTVMMPFIYGFAIAYLLTPALNFVENKLICPLAKKLKLNTESDKAKKNVRTIGIIITMFLFLLAIWSFIQTVIPQVVASIMSLINSFPDYVDQLSTWVQTKLHDNPNLEAIIEANLGKYGDSVSDWLEGFLLPKLNGTLELISARFLVILKTLWNWILGIIISIYMMASKETFAAQTRKFIYAFFNEKNATNILIETKFIHKTFGGFIVGKILDSVIIGFICFIVCSILKMPYTLLVSVIVGVTNIIPFFGPYLGAVPSALLILLVSPKQCLYFIIFVFILQQLDGNVIGPAILGGSTGLSGFWVIFAIIIFGGYFGIVGMFIGVPVFAVIYNAMRRLIIIKLNRKQLPIRTEEYEGNTILPGTSKSQGE